MKQLFSFLMVSLFLFGSGLLVPADEAKKDGVKHVNAKEAAKLLKKDSDIVVLDIRTPREYKRGHLKGAKNIDFYEDSFQSELGKLDRTKTYLVHCASGGRSGRSLDLFKKLDFKDVIHLDGGFRAWEKSDLPVEK